MNYTIKSFRNLEEAQLILSFLKWQGYDPEFIIEDNSILSLTGGRDIPILYDNNIVVGKGFYEIYSLFKENNLLR